MKFLLRVRHCMAFLLLVVCSTEPAAKSSFLAMPIEAKPAGDWAVGDKPPPLALGDFLKGVEFRAFKPGTVYVVEFWATWCRPCIEEMPHFNKLVKQYPNVVFLYVDVWDKDPDAVKDFVKRMGDKMNFTIALDGDQDEDGTGTMAKTWLTAFGGKGLPSTVVIDGTGTVAWMGAPNKIDEPLKAIVAGTWNLASAVQQWKLRRQIEKAVETYDARIQESLDAGPEKTAAVLAEYAATLKRLQSEFEAAAKR